MSQITSFGVGGGTGTVSSLTGNIGGAINPALGNINILGDGTTLSFSGAGSTLTLSLATATTAIKGGVTLATDAEVETGTDTSKAVASSSLAAKLGTQTLHGIALGAGTTGATVLAWTAEGATGQTLMGTTGNNPGWTGSPTFSGTATALTLATSTAATNLSINANTISAAGSDANVAIGLTAKAAGNINITTAGTAYNNGLIVLRAIPTGGWSNTEWRTGQAAVQTTNATPTAILTIPLVNSLMVSVKILINGFQSDYSDCVGGEILVTAYRAAAGDIKLVGAPIINVNYTDTVDTSDIDASIDVPSQSLLLKVVGVAAQNWNWVATYTYMYTISNA